jgi:DNA-binding transcriptional LysR family regulator
VPADRARHRGLLRRSIESGRLMPWTLRNGDGAEVVATVRPVAVMDDPEALARAVACALGIALLPLPHALPLLQSGDIVRVLPAWYADTRPLSIYYSSRRLLPAKVRAFVDHVVTAAAERRYGAMFAPKQPAPT